MSLTRKILKLHNNLKWCLRQVRYILKADDINCFIDVPAKEHRVNIYDYKPQKYGFDLYNNSPYNLGDSLGIVICQHLLSERNINIDAYVSCKKHLFTVGSNIFGSNIKGNYQNATIWGSGIIQEPTPGVTFFQKIARRKLDIRAVRGPLTRNILLKFGHKCPERYGDPAVLMPLIYQPKREKRHPYSVILQFVHERKFRGEHPNELVVSMNTNDYKSVIDEIAASEIVYTSSLHGIILAESYGVPAIFFRGLGKSKDFKYLDYYYSTGRKDVKIAESFEEALTMKPLPLPDLSKMQQDLLESFPYDLWE